MNKNMCPICEKNFSKFSNLKRHLINSKSCIKKDDTIDKKNQEISKNNFLYECEDCGRKTKYKNSYYRHRKRFCEKRKEETVINDTGNELINLKLNYNELEKENKKNIQKIKKLESKLTELFSKSNITVSENSGNIGNVNTGSQQINISNNFHINTYGNEDLSRITMDDWLYIIKRNRMAIPYLVKKIHINTKNNRNLYISNIKDSYGLKLDSITNTWKLVALRKLLDEIVVDSANRIDDFICENSAIINDKDYKNMDKLVNDINKDDIRDDQKILVKEVLVNGKKIIKDYYETNTGNKLSVGNGLAIFKSKDKIPYISL